VLTVCYYVHTDNIDIHVGRVPGDHELGLDGAVMTLIVTTLLGMSGFYLVNNCVSRARADGSGPDPGGHSGLQVAVRVRQGAQQFPPCCR